MNQSVRFYWQHDLDLVALAVHPHFDFSGWFKIAITAWARGEELTIPLPRNPQPFSVNMENKKICFYLSPEKDADVIKALQGIRKGYRNSAMKLIFRTYLENPYLEPYYNEQTFKAKVRGSSSMEKSIPDNKIVPKQKNSSNNDFVEHFAEKDNTHIYSENVSNDVKEEVTSNTQENVIQSVKSMKDVNLEYSNAMTPTVPSLSEPVQHVPSQATTENVAFLEQQKEQFIQEYLRQNPAIVNDFLKNIIGIQNPSLSAENMQSSSVMNTQSVNDTTSEQMISKDIATSVSNMNTDDFDITDEEPDECYEMFNKM